MAGTAQLVKVCRFAQTLAGCNVADPNNIEAVFLHLVTTAEGEPIPPTSTAYPVGTSTWVGDGSGFIRSFYTDVSFAVLAAGTVDFSTSCGGAVAGGAIITKKLLSGKLLLKYYDEQAGPDPGAALSAGVLDISMQASQVPLTARFIGTAGDLSAGQLLINTIGGKYVTDEINAADGDGFWPNVYRDDRNVLNTTQPYQQLADDRDDSFNAFNERITTPGTITKRLTGLAGDFGLTIIF